MASRSRLARATLARPQWRPSSPAGLDGRGATLVECAYRPSSRHRRADVPITWQGVSGGGHCEPGASVPGSDVTPVRGSRKPPADAAPRQRCRGRVLSFGHTRGSPTPAELLIVRLSWLFSPLGRRVTAPRIHWSLGGRPGNGRSARRLSLRRPRPSRSHLTTTTLKRKARICPALGGDSIRP
jgi:hypothetical protein